MSQAAQMPPLPRTSMSGAAWLRIAGAVVAFVVVAFLGILVVGGFVWLALLLVILMCDYFSRGWLPYPGK